MFKEFAESEFLKCLVFGIQILFYLGMLEYLTLDTKYKTTFCEVTNFILYRDFGLCYLIALLEMTKNGDFMRSDHEEKG
jgi:hypothetical protein